MNTKRCKNSGVESGILAQASAPAAQQCTLTYRTFLSFGFLVCKVRIHSFVSCVLGPYPARHWGYSRKTAVGQVVVETH